MNKIIKQLYNIIKENRISLIAIIIGIIFIEISLSISICDLSDLFFVIGGVILLGSIIKLVFKLIE